MRQTKKDYIHVYFKPEDKKIIKDTAEKEGSTMSEYIRDVVKKDLNNKREEH